MALGLSMMIAQFCDFEIKDRVLPPQCLIKKGTEEINTLTKKNQISSLLRSLVDWTTRETESLMRNSAIMNILRSAWHQCQGMVFPCMSGTGLETSVRLV